MNRGRSVYERKIRCDAAFTFIGNIKSQHASLLLAIRPSTMLSLFLSIPSKLISSKSISLFPSPQETGCSFNILVTDKHVLSYSHYNTRKTHYMLGDGCLIAGFTLKICFLIYRERDTYGSESLILEGAYWE